MFNQSDLDRRLEARGVCFHVSCENEMGALVSDNPESIGQSGENAEWVSAQPCRVRCSGLYFPPCTPYPLHGAKELVLDSNWVNGLFCFCARYI